MVIQIRISEMIPIGGILKVRLRLVVVVVCLMWNLKVFVKQ